MPNDIRRLKNKLGNSNSCPENVRTSRLIARAYYRLLWPNISSNICLMLMVFADSLIAARYIGTGALAAIALLEPIFLFASVLHDLTVSGVMSVVTRYKSRGESKKAALAFGAMLMGQLTVYIGVYGLLLLLIKPLLHLFTRDEVLISDSIRYFIPFAIAQPFLEAGLCLERGFRTDGRPGFFCARGVIANVLNILFNLIAVVVFRSGIVGLSLASVAANAIGYMWSGSHFFHKKCTLRPDLSVIRRPKEMLGYIREEAAIGSVFAIDDGVYTLVGVVLNKGLILAGGTTALECCGVMTSACSLIGSFSTAVQSAFFQLSEMFYSDRDIDGTKAVFRLTVIRELAFGSLFCLICAVFPPQIGILFKAGDPAIMDMLPVFLTFGSISCVFTGVSNVFSSFMIATKRNKRANMFNIVNNIGLMIGIIAGRRLWGLNGLLIGRMAAALILLCGEALYIFRSGVVFREENRSEIMACSYELGEQSMNDVSTRVYDLFISNPLLAHEAVFASLLIEECNRQLLYRNRENSQIVMVDMRVSVDGDRCRITLTDDGEIFDPIVQLDRQANPEIIDISAKLLMGLPSESSYSRVFDLNNTHLVFGINRHRSDQ